MKRSDHFIGAISLGCSKNRVDTELMLGQLVKAGYNLTPDPEEADVILINTCGFIDDAKQESIDTILEMARYKETGKLKLLIIAGCLSGRYREEVSSNFPEVDVFLGVTPHDDIVEMVDRGLEGERLELYHEAVIDASYQERILTTPAHYAYVKIAEGCNNFCTYCAIPRIRGRLKSRTEEDIVSEVMWLADMGTKEIILVAQDTSKYGLDLYGEPRICSLLEKLSGIDGIEMIRLLYCYPDGVTDELVKTIVGHDNIANYIDIPVQHVDDEILKRMNRHDTGKTIYEAVRRLRDASDDFILRSTVIVGFPGETEEQFERLLNGINDLKFDRLGAFRYSQEDNTPAALMPDQIDDETKEYRLEQVMFTQQKISNEMNKKRIGKVYKVLIEDYDEEEDIYFGRSYAETPEVDGLIVIHSDRELETGEYVSVKIIRADDYEITGTVIE